MGTLQALVYNSTPALIDVIDDVLEGAQITDGVRRVGSATFSARLGAQGVSSATIGKEVRLNNVGEGVIFRGYIEKRTVVVDRAGAAIVQFQCASLAIELTRRSVWRSVLVLAAGVESAMDSLLADTSPAWTSTLTGSGYQNVTKEWINITKLAALAELAEIANAYWRETTTARDIEIKNTNASSGIVLANVAMSDGSANSVGVIESVNRVEEDASAIVNRVGLEVKTDQSRLITLQEATRVSPYTVASDVRRAARVVTSTVDLIITAGTYLVAFPMLGENRYALGMAIATVDSNSVAVIGGQFMSLLEQASGNVAGLWGGVAPPKNSPQTEFKLSFASTSAGAVVGIENVDQIDPVIDSGNNSGSSGTASITVNSETDSVVVCILILRTLGTPTVTANGSESLVEKLGGGVFDDDQVTVWQKPGGASTTSFSFSISPSQQWEIFAVSLRAAASYYIEDTTSQTTYGVKEKVLPLGGFNEVEESRTAIANAGYDFLSDYLTRMKDPILTYEITCSHIPNSPLTWLPGDTVKVAYHTTDLAIDDDLIVVERTQTFDRSGKRRWDLTLSDRAQFRRDEQGVWLLNDIIARLQAAQAAQV